MFLHRSVSFIRRTLTAVLSPGSRCRPLTSLLISPHRGPMISAISDGAVDPSHVGGFTEPTFPRLVLARHPPLEQERHRNPAEIGPLTQPGSNGPTFMATSLARTTPEGGLR